MRARPHRRPVLLTVLIPVAAILGALLAAVGVRAQVLAPVPYLRVETGTHQAVINGLAMLAGGDAVVSVSDDKTARIWDTRTLRPLGVIRPPIGPGDDGALDAVATAGPLIAVGGRIRYADGFAVQFYRFPELRLIGHRSGLPAPVSALRFSADGRTLAIGMVAGRGLAFMDMHDGTLAKTDAAYGGQVQWIDTDAQGRTVASGEDGRIRLYGPDHGKIGPDSVLPNGARPYAVAFSPDGKLIAAGVQNDPTVWLLDAATLRRVRALSGAPGLGGGFNVVAFTPDGAAVLGAGTYKAGTAGARKVRRWRLDGVAASEFDAGDETVTDLLPMADALLFSDAKPVLTLLDPAGHALATQGAQHLDFRDAGLTGFAVSADGTAILLPTGGADPLVFDARQRTLAPRSASPGLTLPSDHGPGQTLTSWRNSAGPRLNGKAVALEQDERSLSAAAAPDGSGTTLGTNFFVRFQRRDGQAWQTVAPAPAWAVNVSADGQWVLAGLGDGTVRWYDSASGRERLALFLAPATGSAEDAAAPHWVLSTPEGFFDHDQAAPGQADGRGLIGFRFNDPEAQVSRYVEVGQLYPLFYRPDLVGLSIRPDPTAQQAIQNANEQHGSVTTVLNRGLPPAIVLLDACGRPPDGAPSGCPPERGLDTPNPPAHPGMRLATRADAVVVRFRLDNPGGQPGRAVITRNAAIISPGLVTAAEDAHSRTQEALIRLGLGPNRIRLLPVSANGEVEGSDAQAVELTVWHDLPPPPPAPAPVAVIGPVPPAPAPAAAPPPATGRTLYLLSVGVSQFSHSELNLDNASNDARAIAALMDTADPKVYDRPVSTTLLDAQATIPAITAALRGIADAARPDDLVVLFFAGHGQEVDGRYYFAPADLGTHNPELFERALAGGANGPAAIDQLFRTEGLGPDQLLPLIQAMQATHIAVLLDTCYSASLATQDAVLQRDVNTTVTNGIGHATGRFVLSSATTLALDSSGVSGDIPQDGKGHGLFTAYLLEALEGRADLAHEGLVNVVQLAQYTIAGVKRATATLKQKQEPMFFFAGNDFFVLRSDGLTP